MKPEDGTVEAVETKYGAPILLVLWHPEAYAVQENRSTVPEDHSRFHQNLIRFMAQAGDACYARRRVVQTIVDWRNKVSLKWEREELKRSAFIAEFGNMTLV